MLRASVIGCMMACVSSQIVNGGFEEWVGGQPVGWSVDPLLNVSESSISGTVGNASLLALLTTRDQSQTDLRQTVTLVAGEEYQLNASVLFREVGARIRWFADGKYLNYLNPYTVSRTNKWLPFSSNIFAATSNEVEIGIRFYDKSSFDGEAPIYIDSVDIRLLGVRIPSFADLPCDITDYLKDNFPLYSFLKENSNFKAWNPSVCQFQSQDGSDDFPFVKSQLGFCSGGLSEKYAQQLNASELLSILDRRTQAEPAWSQQGLSDLGRWLNTDVEIFAQEAYYCPFSSLNLYAFREDFNDITFTYTRYEWSE